MGRDTSFVPEERETKLQALREAIRDGVESGPANPIDFDALLRELNAEQGA